MSDLISRSEVLELLYKIFDEYYMSTDKNPSILIKSFGTDIFGSFGTDVFKKIKEMPTAYSVDNVVEELELHSFEFGTDILPAHYVRLNDAIEIVNQGGVSDNMCEWKYTKEIIDNAEFKVGCNQNALKKGTVPNNFSYHDFKYCPYCGRRIKIVGD